MGKIKNLPEDWFERKKIAADPNTSQETLAVLADDKDWRVREGVARNHNTSKETLDKLSEDDVIDVRLGVAANSNTSPETLDKLSKEDKSRAVRYTAMDTLREILWKQAKR